MITIDFKKINEKTGLQNISFIGKLKIRNIQYF